MRTPILFLLCSLVLGSACGQAGASVGQVPAPAVAAVPAAEAEVTFDVLELI